jgi:ubiquinone/menaquinone biosynthesis C-methylase UbiE
MWQRVIDGQYRRPSGLLGRWIGRKMAQQHMPENCWTVDLLAAEPADRILEIGFGPGLAIEQLAQQVTLGLVSGVDYSRTMVTTARIRNLNAIRQGRVDLRYGHAAQLPFADCSFNKAFSIHSIYFWPEPVKALQEIRRVLRPNGKLILTILPKERWHPPGSLLPVGTPECTPYSGAELETMLRQVGFSNIFIKADGHNGSASNYSVIASKS